jgi:hypothetical protein
VLLSRHLSKLPSALARVLDHPGEYGSRVRDPVARPEHRRQHQRRLKPNEIDALAGAYIRGETLDALAEMFGIHRTTVLAHLKRRGLRRPPAMSEAQVLDCDSARPVLQLEDRDLEKSFRWNPPGDPEVIQGPKQAVVEHQPRGIEQDPSSLGRAQLRCRTALVDQSRGPRVRLLGVQAVQKFHHSTGRSRLPATLAARSAARAAR